VATVIYCTGYNCNLDMLDVNLRPKLGEPVYSNGEMPKDWRMSKNSLSKELGDVPPGLIRPDPPIIRDDVYRGRLISIPSMFFMFEQVDTPLFDIDIAAWRTLAQVTGDLPLPPSDKIHQFNMETLLVAMNDPTFRFDSDCNYRKHWEAVIDDPDNHWTDDVSDDRVKAMLRTYSELLFRFLAREALDSGYPLNFGTFEKLNKKGNALVSMDIVDECSRYEMDEFSPDAEWRTFRDCDPSKCRSIHSGEKAVPFKCCWLELESCEIKDIVDLTVGEEKCTDRCVQANKKVLSKLRSGSL